MLALASQRKSTSLVNRTYFGSLFPAPSPSPSLYTYIAVAIDIIDAYYLCPNLALA